MPNGHEAETPDPLEPPGAGGVMVVVGVEMRGAGDTELVVVRQALRVVDGRLGPARTSREEVVVTLSTLAADD